MVFDKKISEQINLPIDLVIPSINGGPLSCCWGCNLGEGNINLYGLKHNLEYKSNQHNNFDIDLLYQIKAEYINTEDDFNQPVIETKFFMKPGTIADLFNEITSQVRKLWFLKNCQLLVFNGEQELVPSNETMISQGIETGSILTIFRKFDKLITIDNRPFACNLDDPVEELMLRYSKKCMVQQVFSI